MANLACFCDVVGVVVTEGINAVSIGERLVPMLECIAVRVDHLNQAIIAQENHIAHLIAVSKGSVGRHDKTATLSQLVNHVLLHVEVLHEGEVGPIHRFGSDADLMRLAE